jgi:hypothetical protein
MPYQLTQEQIEAIPEQLLVVPEFVEIWKLWIEHREKIVRAPITNLGAKKQLNLLLKHVSHANPVEVILRSMDSINKHGKYWTGLFPENVFSYNDNGQEQKRNQVVL